MSGSDNELKPAGPEKLAELRAWLEQDPTWRRMKGLHAKDEAEGLTPEEAEELRAIVTPKFQDGDVIQEFARDLEAAKAKRNGKDAS
jgi:hypothetical protein